jgi:hypothetical protein
VHIQISYDPNTNAEKFAWMIPLTAVPEFSVGSQPLFDQIRAARCRSTTSRRPSRTAAALIPAGSASAGLSGDPTPGRFDQRRRRGTGGDGPTVLLEETVGAFDVAVLQDTELAPIQAWLEDNGYLGPERGADPEQYLARAT